MGSKQRGVFIGGNDHNQKKIQNSNPGFSISVRADVKKLAAIARYFEENHQIYALKSKGTLLKTAFDLLYDVLEHNEKVRLPETVAEASGYLEGWGLGPTNSTSRKELMNALAMEDRTLDHSAGESKPSAEELISEQSEKEALRHTFRRYYKGDMSTEEFGQLTTRFASRPWFRDIKDEVKKELGIES